ncbi:hydrolase, alpha/beta fold family [Lysobacter enzymogenes]|uniref:Hydrolase, alpha/beta fold family n=1 Tax=Lysobacter enzymogenes TaxID=69 RepID=A0A0S2DRH6_LYSEN|nr:alpha/beta hydrolase [Lysobacter enzymogenes]ALN60792.1 hydrolase, alpha/beta fold family [Lysobacter enzymogenes]QCW24366.1 alpha/beta hydrolase [Lysobacter enzymogenes]
MPSTSSQSVSPEPESLWIAGEGGRLFAQRWPRRDAAAAPIVLLHDSLGCVALWRDFPARLAAASGREVIAYDRLGFGRSDPHPGALAADFVASEAGGGLRAVCDALRLQRFVLFGHSVGGGMAVAGAALHRSRCAGLIAESAQAFVEDRTRAGILAARAAFARPEQMERLRKYHGDKAPWVLRAWIDTWLDDGFAGWNLDAPLAQVACPTLVLHGDGDEFGSARHPERIAAGVAGAATLRLLADCGHVPHRERGDEVLGIVAAWLESSGA